MRKSVIALLALGLVVATTAFASNDVRISQVYTGGGSSSGYYIKDYVELFNSGSVAVDLGSYALQYGSATGSSFGSASYNWFNFPAGTTIQPCGYLLIETSSAGSGGVALPVPADFSTTSLSMSGSSGKLALVNNQNPNNLCSNPSVFIDLFGYGTANCYEGTAAPNSSTTTTFVRNNGGMTDTDNNFNDFTVAATSGVTMHNSLSPRNPDCLAVPAKSTTWGKIKTIYR